MYDIDENGEIYSWDETTGERTHDDFTHILITLYPPGERPNAYYYPSRVMLEWIKNELGCDMDDYYFGRYKSSRKKWVYSFRKKSDAFAFKMRWSNVESYHGSIIV